MPTIRLAAATLGALFCAAAASAQTLPGPQSAPSVPSPATPSAAVAGHLPDTSAPTATAPAAMAPAASAPATSAPATNPPAAAGDTTASTGVAADTNATVLSPGLTVKDNTGAAIGQITDMKADPAGGQLVTINMGADKFRVPSDKLAVQNGSAVINLTQAQIEDELHPKKKR